MDAISGYKLSSFIDAFLGYNQIQMVPKNEGKIAFIIESGLYYYKTIPFGLKNT